ncbi:MAG: methylated-DNA--[protein]-cysteine S-methyltransferase [Parcubacteria group bacterium]
MRYITWSMRLAGTLAKPTPRRVSALLQETVLQLEEYFAGRRTRFNLPLDLQGTVFQQRVWLQLLRVPFGERLTYAELARQIGKPGAAQAVGQAVKENPLPIIVPCHRIVPTATKKAAKDGQQSIGGYNGGRLRKKWLLEHEARESLRREPLRGKTVQCPDLDVAVTRATLAGCGRRVTHCAIRKVTFAL